MLGKTQEYHVLSFYRSKIIWTGTNCFCRGQIVFVGGKLFWWGTNHFGQVKIRLFWTNFYKLDLSKIIWISPKQFGPAQNDWYSTKMIWTHRRTRHQLLVFRNLVFRLSNGFEIPNSMEPCSLSKFSAYYSIVKDSNADLTVGN